MKTLYLIRHAKAAQEEPGLADAKRPLIKTGIERTKKIVEYLLDNSVIFDLMIASHATRAMETAKLMAARMEYPEDKIMCDKRIYCNDLQAFFDILFGLDDSISDVAIVGHNPLITEFANYFLDDKIVSMPTSSVVCIEIDTDQWTQVNLVSSTKQFFITP